MMTLWKKLCAAALAAGALGAPAAHAQVFIPGDLVVERVGDGTAALGSVATASFLDQYDPLAAAQLTPLTSTALPTTVGTSGGALAATDSGSATSNAQFTRTLNGQALVVTGYNSAPGTAGVAGSNPATTNRSIALVTSPSLVNTTNGFSDGPSNNFRSVASVDGAAFYLSTAGTATAPGIQFKSATSTVTTTTPILNGNERNVRILSGANGNSLFVSSASANGPGVGIALVGTAGTLPTALVTGAVLPGTATSGTGTPSPYGFDLFDNPLNPNSYLGTGFNLLYVADDRTTATGGGIQRWEYNGSTWALDATLGTTGTGGARGLTGSITNNVVTLFATTAETSSNNLIGFTDTVTGSFAGGGTGGVFSPLTTLATAGTNEAFRGVDFAPTGVPEPGTMALCGLAAAGVASRRLRRKGK
jgi:hypothetical protein